MSLSGKDKKFALPILMFMAIKRDGTLKSRGCVDGRPQRLWTKKEDVASQTRISESLKFILALIANEGRDAASFDLPGQFLQTDMEDTLYLKLSRALALPLVESDPGMEETSP